MLAIIALVLITYLLLHVLTTLVTIVGTIIGKGPIVKTNGVNKSHSSFKPETPKKSDFPEAGVKYKRYRTKKSNTSRFSRFNRPFNTDTSGFTASDL